MHLRTLLHTLLPIAAFLGIAYSVSIPEPKPEPSVGNIDRSLSCRTSTPNIPNEILSMAPPLDNSDWVIRFGSGHHTTDTALACSSTLDTPDYYWEVSSHNISYNTCHMISPILGGRLPARAAIWLGGNSNLNSITMFYESSLEPVCSAGQNTWCNVASKAGWYCLSNMYLVNSFSVSGV